MAAIFFEPEAYSVDGPKLMGRNAAGHSFLKGYLRNTIDDDLWIYSSNKNVSKFVDFTNSNLSFSKPIKHINPENFAALETCGNIFYPGPSLSDLALNRSFIGNSRWSISGITHTTSSIRAMDEISSLLTSSIFPWDALICTSNAVKSHVKNIFSAKSEFLKERFNAQKFPLPQLPVIPLGINTKEFSFSQEYIQESRKSLKIPPDAVVILYVGRLSFHAKAHPLAMYQALQNVFNSLKKPIHLIECGWFNNKYIEESFRQASSQICPDISLSFIDGRKLESKNMALASSDIFCSFSDNIQETFGLTPIEAMAAGIPVVVSDWNGYKDTVQHGTDGFLVPTTMPQAGTGKDLIFRYSMGIDNYDMYLGNTSSLIAVDIDLASKYLGDLIKSSELRNKISVNAKKKASHIYDWSVIIPQYENLWGQLTEIRQSQISVDNTIQTYKIPTRMDPFLAFNSYSSEKITNDTKFKLSSNNLDEQTKNLETLLHLSMVNYASYILPEKGDIISVFNSISSSSKSVSDVLVDFPLEKHSLILRSFSWLYKMGLVRPVL